MEDEGIIIPVKQPMMPMMQNRPQPQNNYYQQQPYPQLPMYSATVTNSPIAMMNYYNHHPMEQIAPVRSRAEQNLLQIDLDISTVRLSKLQPDDLVSLLRQISELKMTIEKLEPILKENSISGRVLMHCDLSELKTVKTALNYYIIFITNKKCNFRFFS